MDLHVLLRKRIAKVISEIPLDDPILVAVHAGYSYLCKEHEFSAEYGEYGTPESARHVLAVSLQCFTTVLSIPDRARPYLNDLPTDEFKSLLVKACNEVEDFCLQMFIALAKVRKPPLDPFNDFDLKRLINESFLDYICRSDGVVF